MVVPAPPFVVGVFSLYAFMICVGVSGVGPCVAAGWAWKSGCAVQSVSEVVAFAVDAIAGKLITRISKVKITKVLALFPLILNIKVNAPIDF